jgi:hypothetical protein
MIDAATRVRAAFSRLSILTAIGDEVIARKGSIGPMLGRGQNTQGRSKAEETEEMK